MVRVKGESDGHYLAAADYLELLVGSKDAGRIVAALHKAPLSYKKAKDIARASGLPILGITDREVATHIDRLRSGEAIAPLLLVRGRLAKRVPLTIAGGYHRPLAVYHLNEDDEGPCKIADL